MYGTRYTASVHRIRHNRIMTHTKQPVPESARQNTDTCTPPLHTTPISGIHPANRRVQPFPLKAIHQHALQAQPHRMTTHDTLYCEQAKWSIIRQPATSPASMPHRFRSARYELHTEQIEAPVYKPQCSFYTDHIERATAILKNILPSPFIDRNKMTAWVICDAILRIQGITPDGYDVEIYRLIIIQ